MSDWWEVAAYAVLVVSLVGAAYVLGLMRGRYGRQTWR